MLIRFLQSIAGEHFAYRPRQIAEIQDELAAKFIASGIAAPFAIEPETASLPVPENKARTARKR